MLADSPINILPFVILNARAIGVILPAMKIAAIVRNKGLAFVLCSAFLPTLGACTPKVDDSSVARVSVTEVARRVEKGSNVLLLDARDKSQYVQGHVPAARLVSLPDIEPFEPTPAFEGYSSLIVYGENPGSGTAMALAKRLLQAKHKNVQLMLDGFDGWKAQGLPIAKGDTPGK